MAETSLALITDLEKSGVLSTTGLRLREEMSYERFEAMLALFGAIHQSMQFAIGDALLYGEALFGEEVYQASEVLKLAPDTRNRYRRVAERVPINRRRPELSWSHHFVVSTLQPEEQIEWLQRAVDNDYSKHDLEELLREPKLPADKTVVCPSCGETFMP
jgi:hypothetical protein